MAIIRIFRGLHIYIHFARNTFRRILAVTVVQGKNKNKNYLDAILFLVLPCCSTAELLLSWYSSTSNLLTCGLSTVPQSSFKCCLLHFNLHSIIPISLGYIAELIKIICAIQNFMVWCLNLISNWRTKNPWQK